MCPVGTCAKRKTTRSRQPKQVQATAVDCTPTEVAGGAGSPFPLSPAERPCVPWHTAIGLPSGLRPGSFNRRANNPSVTFGDTSLYTREAMPCPALISLPTCGSLCPAGKCALRTHFPPACGPVVQSSQKALLCHLLVSLPTCGSFSPSGKCALRTRFPPVPFTQGRLNCRAPHSFHDPTRGRSLHHWLFPQRPAGEATPVPSSHRGTITPHRKGAIPCPTRNTHS